MGLAIGMYASAADFSDGAMINTGTVPEAAASRELPRIIEMRHVLAICAFAVAGDLIAQTHDHLIPCDEFFSGYFAKAQEFVVQASDDRTELLILISDLRPERGIRLAARENEFELVSYEFDRSFWGSSWVEGPANTTVLDFDQGSARARSVSARLPQAVATKMIAALSHEIESARPAEPDLDESTEIILDAPLILFGLGPNTCAHTFLSFSNESRTNTVVAVALAARSYVHAKRRDREKRLGELSEAIDVLTTPQ